MSRPQRLLVLGAGGFLGSHLVPALLREEGVSVDAVDLNFHKLAHGHPRLRRHVADISQPGALNPLLERCDLVLSLTALCTPALYNVSPLAVIDANYTHLVPVVERCAERRLRLIHFSTCEVYGRVAVDGLGAPSERMQEDETALLLGPIHRERWSYACAKQLLERVIWAHGQHHGLNFTIIRPFNVIGPRMDFLPGIDGEGVPRVLPCFMNALLRDEELLLVDGGEQRRSFISVDDFVSAVVRVVELPEATRGEIFNLGNPSNDVTIRELAGALSDEYRRQVPHAVRPRFRHVDSRDFYGEGYDDSLRRIPNIEKAERLLGFRPSMTLREMLPAIVADYVARYADLVNSPPLPIAAGEARGV
jgi:UDP-apiose/xylose synthase